MPNDTDEPFLSLCRRNLLFKNAHCARRYLEVAKQNDVRELYRYRCLRASVATKFPTLEELLELHEWFALACKHRFDDPNTPAQDILRLIEPLDAFLCEEIAPYLGTRDYLIMASGEHVSMQRVAEMYHSFATRHLPKDPAMTSAGLALLDTTRRSELMRIVAKLKTLSGEQPVAHAVMDFVQHP